MKIFITGVSGFIGGRLVESLIQKKYQTAGLVRNLSSNIKSRLNGCKLYHYRDNLDSIKNALQDFRPDVVIHLASFFQSNHLLVDIDPLVESNILLSARLYEAMLEVGINKIINTGTSWEHYEDASFNPVNLYAATKGAAESILDYYSNAKNFTTFNFKLFDTYGPGDTRKKLFFHLREAVRSGVILKMSPGEQLINLVYVDDIISAYIQAIGTINEYSGKHVFGVGAEKLISLKNLVAFYSSITKKEVPVHFGALPYREREVMMPWTNYRNIPNWSPKVSLEEGIIRMESDVTIGGLLSGEF